jgi:hypothetical protein
MGSSDDWAGNTGEWGEAFVLLKLLGEGVIYNADSNCNRIDDERNEIRAIYRSESPGENLAFIIMSPSSPDGDTQVAVLRNNESVICLPREDFKVHARELFEGLKDHQGASFTLPEQSRFLSLLGCRSLKPTGTAKADLIARVREGFIGAEIVRNYSIKTLIGANPSLANASTASVVEFRLDGFDAEKADVINSIGGRNMMRDRVRKLLSMDDVSLKPWVPNRTFRRNLRQAHWFAPVAVPLAALYAFGLKGKWVLDAIDRLRDENPARDQDDMVVSDYESAIRKYLWAVTFSMTPARPWQGPETVDGYLIATAGGEVLAYQVSRQRSFEDYLLQHTKFDTPSLSRLPDDVGHVVKRDDTWVFSLPIAIRFDGAGYKQRQRSVPD